MSSPITGQTYQYFDENEAYRRSVKAHIAVSISVAGVICTVVGVFSFQIWVAQPHNAAKFTFFGIALGGILAAGANAVAIMICNTLYTKFALFLNDYENHRTDTIYEDNLIAKIFIFQLINSYASLFYVAFIKFNVLGINCVGGNCTGEVGSTLNTLFLTRLVTANLTEILLPILTQRSKALKEAMGLVPVYSLLTQH